MRAVIQRVNHASVTIDGRVTAKIGQGFLIYVGFHLDDQEDMILKMAQKIKKLRLFDDEQGRINLDILTIKGSILVVSQFTLYADARNGNRPSFVEAMPPGQAQSFYHLFVKALIDQGLDVQSGVFQAHMFIHSENDGPVTILLEM
ncbi:MAG: D-tyrosyl-tRNA(Tyr) deacylase [Acholeplasmataceae bacterium]|nr:D-tyrosyl-tRNA(Tyr) deacylase [Acholeplasmataceae bacterium]